VSWDVWWNDAEYEYHDFFVQGGYGRLAVGNPLHCKVQPLIFKTSQT